MHDDEMYFIHDAQNKHNASKYNDDNSVYSLSYMLTSHLYTIIAQRLYHCHKLCECCTNVKIRKIKSCSIKAKGFLFRLSMYSTSLEATIETFVV